MQLLEEPNCFRIMLTLGLYELQGFLIFLCDLPKGQVFIQVEGEDWGHQMSS